MIYQSQVHRRLAFDPNPKFDAAVIEGNKFCTESSSRLSIYYPLFKFPWSMFNYLLISFSKEYRVDEPSKENSHWKWRVF